MRPTAGGTAPELRPIARDVQALLRELEHQFRPTDESQQRWTQETLRAVLRGEMRGHDIIVVSNREPYIHVKTPKGVHVQQPASGLVTALEPVMRACSGTWIAHGSGSADREMVDRNDRVAVPPEHPTYRIRRLWLTPEQVAGYYDGFANEGLWPLCHIAHVRPTFRTADWEQYRAVNAKFADAVVAEAESEDPVVLVQDYHFALLPRMIRERLPKATIIAFWHIPWPNPEAFAICPWRVELLDGLLGSDILGFHTQFHCNNFLETVDRFVEARIDRETFTVVCRGERTAVHRYPISIEWPPAPLATALAIDEARERVRVRLNLPREPQARRRHRPPRLHQGHHRTLQRRRAAARIASGMGRQVHVRPDRRAFARRPSATIGTTRQRVHARWPTRSTRVYEARRIRRSCCWPSITSRMPCTNTCAPPTSASSAACTTA